MTSAFIPDDKSVIKQRVFLLLRRRNGPANPSLHLAFCRRLRVHCGLPALHSPVRKTGRSKWSLTWGFRSLVFEDLTSAAEFIHERQDLLPNLEHLGNVFVD